MAVTNQLEIDIKAKSNKATDSLDTLIAKLNEVNTALNGLNTAKITEISSSMKGLKGVHLNSGKKGDGGASKSTIRNNDKAKSSFERLLGSVTNANKGFKGFRGTMFKLAATWGMFYASMYPVIRLFQFMGKEVEHSMEYVETFNYFKVTMNKIGHDSGEEFTEGFLSQIKSLDKKMTGFKIGKDGELIDANVKNLGIDPNIMMQFQAQIGAVTNSVGLLGETSVATQKAMSMLSADLSSLKNEDLQSVMKNLQSGLIGQSRALYKYGIDITQATLKQYAFKHGVTKSVSAMSQSEKMQLRLLAILDQSKVAWGDQANSIMTVANQYRIMKQQISNLGRTIGNLFLPVVKTILPYLNAFIIALRKVFDMLGGHIYGSNWKKELMEGVSEGNFSGIVEGAEDSEEALNDATKAAKKFKQATMGFDELNIINPQTDSGSGKGSIGGGGFDLSDDIEDALEDYQTVWEEAFKKMENKSEELANKLVSYIKNHDYFGLGRWFSDGLASGLENINWNNLQKDADSVGKGLAELMNGLMSHRLSWDIGGSIAESINTGLHFLNSWAKTFSWSDFGDNLAIGLKAFLKKWDAGLTSETFSNFAKGLLTAMTSFLEESMDRNTFKTFGQKVVDFICGVDWIGLAWDLTQFFDAFGDALIDFPSDFARGFWDKILNKIFNPSGKSTTAKKYIDLTLDTIDFKGIVKRSLEAHLPTLALPFKVANAEKEVGKFLEKVYKSFDEMDVAQLQEDGKKIVDGVIEGFKEGDIKGAIGTFFDSTLGEITAKFGIKKVAEELIPYGGAILGGLIDGFTMKYPDWQKTLENWKTNYVSPFFSKDAWSETGKGIKDGLGDAWERFNKWWKTTGVYKWYTEHVEPLFTEDKWTFDGIAEGLKASFKTAINGVKQLWNDFADWINENLTWDVPKYDLPGGKSIGGFHISLGHLPKFDIPKYAVGGFPEDGLFMANHNELVGQFSNGQTAVANNEQIVEGIRSGVASAVAQTLAPYLREIANNTSDTAHNTDEIAKKPVQTFTDRGIAKANIRGQRSLGLQLRTS